MRYLKVIPLILIFFVASYQRLSFFNTVGKDIYAYERSIRDLVNGVNPYIWTIESFSNPDDPGNHGFAYLPGMLYLNSFLYIVSLASKIPFPVLWKIPVLLADLGVGILLIENLYRKNYLILLGGLLLWFFNPYFFWKSNYVYADPITIFLMFWALDRLEKDDVAAGALFALSVAMKTFPAILFPIFLLKSKNKWQFLSSGLIIAILISIPFMRSATDFVTYLRGALLVHGERFIQGRPFLFYISYFYDVELFQIIPLHIYTLTASFGGWLVTVILYFTKLVRNKYYLALISFIIFYLFTPVLNRTYLLWFLPILIMGTYYFSLRIKKNWAYYLILISFWAFNSWYLLQWKDGFHIWRP